MQEREKFDFIKYEHNSHALAMADSKNFKVKSIFFFNFGEVSK